MTLLPEKENQRYTLDARRAEGFVSWFSNLELQSDYEEKPDEMEGLTWVISIRYGDGAEATVYHFGNMFVRSEDGPWYKISYDDAVRVTDFLPKPEEAKDLSECIRYENGKYTLILPLSRTEIPVRASLAEHMEKVDFDLLKAAEAKIREDAAPYEESWSFHLEEWEGYLCLGTELLVDIEPPASSDGFQSSGCGIDHEHLFFRERITK